ncbi:MAG: inositol monophosphatase [Myxococcota bacterium]|nr:inositol monophosphatase [Myxococcota bacterium]
MRDPSAELQTMIEAALASGAALMRRFAALSEVEFALKGPADFVSAADLESQRTIEAVLSGAYPRHGFLSEENAPRLGDGAARFIVDPLDGTTNFLHGLPHFAIAIALESAGEVVAAVVHDPAKGELFVAELGRGAWLDGRRLRVSEDSDLSSALVATGIPHSNGLPRHERYLEMLAAAMREAAGIRRYAAAALDLAYVAAGRFAAFFELGLAPWDLAAGALLVREAGGRVSEPDGGHRFVTSGNVLATNGRLHPRMVAMLVHATRHGASIRRRRRMRWQ